MTRTYKIWSLKDYSGLFAVKAENVEKVVCSPGKLLLLSAIKDATMVMKIVDVKAKKLLYNFKVRNLEEDKNYFVELFDNSLLLKQTGNEARIINVRYLLNRALTLIVMQTYAAILKSFAKYSKSIHNFV